MFIIYAGQKFRRQQSCLVSAPQCLGHQLYSELCMLSGKRSVKLPRAELVKFPHVCFCPPLPAQKVEGKSSPLFLFRYQFYQEVIPWISL